MSSPPQRIIIAADFLRPLPGAARCATAANGRWLQAMLDWPLQRACDLPVERIHWGEGFDTERFYRLLGTEPRLDAWAALHFAQQLPPAADAMLGAAFANALVIGCELPACVCAALTRAGITVIDTLGTPLRFLDDVLNAWRTNRPEIHQRLQEHRFDDSHAWRQAGLIRAKTAWMPVLPIPEGSALLLGQVGSDKALIHRRDGRLLGFDDYIEELFTLAERHTTVFYKAHPYTDGQGRSEAIVKRFGAFQPVSDNLYRLMSQPGLETVYAISSGGTYEAPYFGKQGERFYDPGPDLDATGRDRHGLFPPIAVDQAWLEPAFWRDVLAPVLEVRPGNETAPPYRPHRIRRSLNADWGFGAIDQVVAAH